MTSFSLDEHNCLEISTENNRILLFLEKRDLEELYGLMESKPWDDV